MMEPLEWMRKWTEECTWAGTRRWLLRKLRQFWPVIPLAAILFALMISDLDVMGYSPFNQDPCDLSEIDQSSLSAKMYLPLAGWALRYTPSPSVALIYIDPRTEPAGLLTNTCASRVFLARLVDDLNALAARVIVIDKYYSADACAEADKNAVFMKSMEGSNVPIVVGQPTHVLSDTSKVSGCLALTDRLDLGKASKVLYGVTRLNVDTLKIPMRWPVFSDPADTQPSEGRTATPAAAPKQLPDESGDTLSLVAARAVDPNLEASGSVPTLLAKQVHPYTTFLQLPNIDAMIALCSAEPGHKYTPGAAAGPDLCDRSVRPLNNLDGNNLSLNGKVVVIADVSEQDMHPFPKQVPPFPKGQVPGAYLQANYVQSLLDRRFLQEIPLWLTLGCLVVYVIGVYCLYWAHDTDGQPRLTAERAGIGSVIVLLGMVLVSLLALVTMSYFTPLWALWGAGVFLVFRYLEASGHHRSQHLLGELAGTKPPAGTAPHSPEALPHPKKGEDER